MLPGAFPGIGHLPAFFSAAPELLAEGRRRLGTLFWLNMGPGLGWHLTCCGREGFELLKNKSLSNAHLSETHPQFISERGVMALEGAAHQRLRGLMAAAFSPKGLGENSAAQISGDVMNEMVAGWASQGRATILADTQRAALDVIFQMLDVPRQQMAEWHKQYRRFAWSALPMPIVDRLVVKPATEWLFARLRALAEEARRKESESKSESVSESGTSVLATLARARNEQGEKLSIDELADNMRLLAFAGHDTSAAAMAWAVIELARQPGLWERLVAEVRKNPRVPKAPIEIREQPLCEAIFRETVRVHPSVPLYSRRTVRPISFSGHDIPEGAIIYVPACDFTRDPEVFGEPEKFDPDRWLGKSTPPSGMELAAFGGGNHFCLGYHLAMLEGAQLLTRLVLTLSDRGMRPRLPPGAAPTTHHLPLSHPAPSTLVVFSA